MVDVALKALSPGVNDVTTAVAAIHHLTAVLVQIAARRIPRNCRTEGARLLVIARAPSFEALLNEAFLEIWRSGTQNPRVLAELTQALHLIGQATRSRSRRRALLGHLELIRNVATSAAGTSQACDAPKDCARVLLLCEQAQSALQQSPREIFQRE
jgi:uncharacterized membrane protein